MNVLKAFRKPFIGGNWKSNGTQKFLESHINFLNKVTFDKNKCDVVIAPTSIHLQSAKKLITNGILVSSQNVSSTGEGAYTGEITAKQLLDIGIEWTLIGHSERRQFYGDTDEEKK